MHSRTFPTLSLLTLAAFAACTDEARCPAGAQRLDGVCVADAPVGADDASLPGDDSGEVDHTLDAGNDADSGPGLCYLDRDHDGVGSGEPVDCSYVPEAPAADAGIDGGSGDAGPDASATEDGGGLVELPQVVMQTGDCDDGDAARAPGFDELCDGIDNDCDDELDEDVRNACGGECFRPLDHQPGADCSNGLLGACERAGVYTCQGDSAVVCSASPVAPSTEVCSDRVDNDCDGLVDEPDAADAALWYQDCDADGYAASTTGAIKACTKPGNAGPCTWTSILPQPSTKTNWDCDDAKAPYSPAADYGFPPSGSSSWDLNCDGERTPDPAPVGSFHDEENELLICNGGLIGRLNEGGAAATACDISGDGRWDGCIVWRNSAGQYVNAPSAKCPDANTFKVRVAYIPADPWGSPDGWNCSVATTIAAWPCR